ncbi:Acb2/Tad1 domain-containing protein [Lonsdalea quercina]|uniref:Acb2/Tad1 domain-containing protein n=1 Tax=Lonsdalea quercina TaxID=71657 RepID=UPI003975A614
MANEAKPQDGSTIKGYRTLTAGDIERMNRIKGVSRHFCNLLDTERETVSSELSDSGNHSQESHEAARCIAIARKKMQEACMWACRAIARPDADC